jgi:polysaccharide biosynthesis/export protein
MQHARTLISFFAFVAVALPLIAQDPSQKVPVPVADLNPSSNLPLQRVGPEDLLGLQVYDAPELTRTVRVSADGTIRLPMLKSPIRVEGLLPNEIETLVAEALQREKLFVDPFVTVNVVEYHSRPITVGGAVKTPTIFQAVGKVTLKDALARAGGLVAGQAGSEIIVTRPKGDDGKPSVQHIPVKPLFLDSDPSLNVNLTGGEEISVPDVGTIVVAGSVLHPGPVPVLDGISNTVTTAIAEAQGTVQYYSHTVYIYRPDEKGVMHEIPVDLGKIQSRKAPDVTLQAKDILFVPDSSRRRITQNTLNSLTGVAGSAAVATVYTLR